jgi:hypothetical protein
MSEERFYQQVKEVVYNYSPEVPQQVYGKMRRALWWSNFTKLSATRFNMWYLLLLLGAGGTAAVLFTQDHKTAATSAAQPAYSMPAQNIVPTVNADVASISTNAAETKAACATGHKGCCTLAQKTECAPAVKTTTNKTTTADVVVATMPNTVEVAATADGIVPNEEVATNETATANTYTEEQAPAKVLAPAKKGRSMKVNVLKDRNEITNTEEKK